MKTSLTIGSSPLEENCQQVGSPTYHDLAKKELRIFIEQLKRQFSVPQGCMLGIETFPHDFGSYSECVIFYDDSVEEQVDFAFMLENNTPVYWDRESIKALEASGIPYNQEIERE